MDISQSLLTRYFDALRHVLVTAEVTDPTGKSVDYAGSIARCVDLARSVHAGGGKLFFIGNGGSAAIASHMATDYSKNGGLRAMALNDSATLTCLSNDLGYENVFARQIDMLSSSGDLLVAISSSGKSASILNAVKIARQRGCQVITLSGFRADNPLRKLGDINYFVASDQYGYVEIAHLTLCHAILDFSCGLMPPCIHDGAATA